MVEKLKALGAQLWFAVPHTVQPYTPVFESTRLQTQPKASLANAFEDADPTKTSIIVDDYYKPSSVAI